MQKNDKKKQWVEGVVGSVRLFLGLSLNLWGLGFIDERLSCCGQSVSDSGGIKYCLHGFKPLSVLPFVFVLTETESFSTFNK